MLGGGGSSLRAAGGRSATRPAAAAAMNSNSAAACSCSMARSSSGMGEGSRLGRVALPRHQLWLPHGAQQQQHRMTVLANGQLPNQADSLFNPDREDVNLGLLEVADKPATRSVADLDYLSVRSCV